MLRSVVEEAAALASLALFLGMIAIWAQVIATLVGPREVISRGHFGENEAKLPRPIKEPGDKPDDCDCGRSRNGQRPPRDPHDLSGDSRGI